VELPPNSNHHLLTAIRKHVCALSIHLESIQHSLTKRKFGSNPSNSIFEPIPLHKSLSSVTQAEN